MPAFSPRLSRGSGLDLIALDLFSRWVLALRLEGRVDNIVFIDCKEVVDDWFRFVHRVAKISSIVLYLHTYISK